MADESQKSKSKSNVRQNPKSNTGERKKISNDFWFPLFVLIVSSGILIAMVYYIIELEKVKKSISTASNKPAGEFAIEPNVSVSKGVLNECTINGIKNQPCVYFAANINEAVNQCNRFPQICNRFVFNSVTQSVFFISLTGNEIISNPNASIHTRQVGVTYSPGGKINNSNSGGFANGASFNSDGSQFTSSGLTSQNNPNIAGGTVTGYY